VATALRLEDIRFEKRGAFKYIRLKQSSAPASIEPTDSECYSFCYSWTN